MLRLIIQTKRRYKKKTRGKNGKKVKNDTQELSSTEDENGDGQSSDTHNDQDSNISVENDTDDEMDRTEIEEENWFDYRKRSTEEAIDKMDDAKIRCWTKTHKRMKSLPNDRWMVKAAEWNPELSSRYKTYRSMVRPRRRWEDDINEFLKLEENETENSTESDNKSCIKAAKDRGKWILLEKDYTRTAEERSENNARQRSDHQSRPARYVTGVRLSEDEVADIT